MARGLGLMLAAGWALGLAGCSGTRFGDQLARSFSGAPANGPSSALPSTATIRSPQSQSNPAQTNPSQANPAEPKPAGAKPPAQLKPAQSSPGASRSLEPRPLPPPQPMAPAPYRVTIKLPAADPSAPAEAVTRALRSAGVSFEVETIERVRNGGQGQGPVVTPAPQPR